MQGAAYFMMTFGYRHKLLVDRLLSQGYEVKRLRSFMAEILISLGSIRGQ